MGAERASRPDRDDVARLRTLSVEEMARNLGLAFRETGPVPAEGTDFTQAIASGIVALRPDEAGFRFAISPAPERVHLLLGHDLGGRSDIVLMPTPAFRHMLRQHCRADILDHAKHHLGRIRPGQSACGGASAAQLIWTVAGAASFGLLLWASLEIGLLVLTLLTLPVFYVLVLIRLSAVIDAWSPLSVGRLPLRDAELPRYSVLVPLYRETAILPQLVKALTRLDYPAALLDIKLITEENDPETAMALRRLALPAQFEVLVAPAGAPQTKPRALNIGLMEARGDLVTIYDAEDRPDPRQLRIAANLFHRLPADVACLQGRLAIDNADDSVISRFFALEYAALFDVINAGLIRVGLPVLLGGTSNHFRTRTLREVGGWDAWNVTEDADLSFRLVRGGHRILDLPSHTLEEAPATFRAWLKQRTRWLKGFLQTSVTHSRQPLVFFRQVGLARGLSLASLCFGTLLSALGYPFFLLFTGFMLNLHGVPEPATVPGLIVLTLWLTLLVAGPAALVAPLIVGARHRGLTDLLVWLPLAPLYFLFVSLAAWLALVEQVRAPTQWNKTEHGLARTSRLDRITRSRPLAEPVRPALPD